MTLADASEWAEQRMSADAYQAEFGEVAEDGSQELVAYRIKASSAEKLRRASRASGKTAAQIINELIDAHLG